MHRLTIIWLLLCVMSLLLRPIHAEESPPSLHQIGRGDIKSITWHPSSTYLLVTTVTGIWIYTPDMQDLAHLPDAHMAVLSPDGRYIAGVDNDHRVRLWDANTFEPIDSPDLGYFRRIWTLAWSNDGRYLAASGNNDGDLTYGWDMTTDNMDVIVATREAGNDLVWSPQSSILAIHSSISGRFSLSGIGKSVQHQIAANANHIAFQDENHILVIHNTDVNVEATRWNINTGEQLAKVWFQSERAVYNHSGQSLAIGRPFNATIVDAGTHEIQISVDTDPDFGWIEAMSWSHNDDWLAVGAYTFSRAKPAAVLLINALTGQVEHHLRGLWQSIRHLAWSNDDRFIAAVDELQHLQVYNAATGELSASNTAHTLVGETLAWNSDSSLLAIAASSTGISIWDTEDMQPIRKLDDKGSPVTTIKWQPHGNYIAVQERERGGFSVGGLLKTQIWDASDSENTDVMVRFKSEPDGALDFLDWSADGEQLAAIIGNVLYLWDVNTGETQAHFDSVYHYLGLEDIRWSPLGDYIIMVMDGHGTGGSYIYNVDLDNAGLGYASTYRGTFVWSPKDELISLNWGTWGDPTPPTSIDVGLSRLAAPNFTSSAADIGERSFLLKGLTQNAQQGFLSPNGHYAAALDAAGSGMIWDATTGLPVTMLADAAQVVWSPDETQLVLQRLDGSIWLLDSTGAVQHQLPISASLQKSEGRFFWSPDSRKLAHLHNGVIDLWQINESI
ncbi:MAG: WD40 repeat domain-containing protein [Chloroflexi bacterium]|nr:WD40 repeat domain-containing protein [Chloroflexota bacterium]MCC6896850.1 WD40 repeat domain-containing protein [Anaerolineae bacterium]